MGNLPIWLRVGSYKVNWAFNCHRIRTAKRVICNSPVIDDCYGLGQEEIFPLAYLPTYREFPF